MTMEKLHQDRERRNMRAKIIAFLALIWFASVFIAGHVLASTLLGRF